MPLNKINNANAHSQPRIGKMDSLPTYNNLHNLPDSICMLQIEFNLSDFLFK